MKALSVLALSGLVLLAVPLATTADQDGPYTYTVSAGQATITDFNTTYSGALSITNTLGGCRVTTIGVSAFRSCTNMTSVTIPDSVTNIGSEAFYYCTALTSVTIGNSVTTIGKNAFNNCTALTSVTIPDSVTTIGEYAFCLCPALRRVYFAGNAPTPGTALFKKTPATLYYLPAFASTWPSTFADRPTVLWNPTTATLATGSLDFTDPDATNYPARFYRIGTP